MKEIEKIKEIEDNLEEAKSFKYPVDWHNFEGNPDIFRVVRVEGLHFRMKILEGENRMIGHWTEHEEFLLKAFKLMRKMAIDLRHDDGQFGWYVTEEKYENIIDKEFEERMK